MAGTGTFTLAEYARTEEHKLKSTVMLGIIRESVIADIMSWKPTGGKLNMAGVRYDEIISPDFIGLDGTISSKFATGKNISYSVTQMALHLDFPGLLYRNTSDNIETPQTTQAKLAMLGAAYKVNNEFINGDRTSDPYGFEGINKLAGELGSSQTVGASEIDLTASYTDALAETLWSRIDTGMAAIEGRKPDAAFTSRSAILKIRSMARQNNLLGDDHDWRSETFGMGDSRVTQRTASTTPAFVLFGVPYYDLGVTGTSMTTQIIGNSYAEGGSSTATRIFFVKFGENEVEGYRAEEVNINDIGYLEDKDVYRKRLLASLGLGVWGPRSIVKVAGIKVA